VGIFLPQVRFAKQQRVPVVQFRKGERKDDVTAEYLKKFKGEEGVLFIGKTQEKSRVFRTERHGTATQQQDRGDLSVADAFHGDGQ
jgi:hypothetical protein